jgi:NAD(P)H dehydrogenase (quinone)
VSDQSPKAPPRHIVVLCHPEQESFNASVANTYSQTVRDHGHEVVVRDLYAMGFHPVLKSAERPSVATGHFQDVEDELAIIRGADVFILVYPIWFGSAPAMLKGYVERVLGSGVVPQAVKDRSAHGALAGKRMLSFTTSGLTEIWLDEQGQLQSLIRGFDHYIEHAFAMLPSRHFHFGSITAEMTPRSVHLNLEEVREHTQALLQELDQASLVASV